MEHATLGIPIQRRWPAALALLAVGVAYALLPQRLRLGPPWLVFAVESVLLVPLLVSHRRGLHDVARRIGLVSVVVVTGAIVVNAVLLLTRLPGGKTPGSDLLRD